ncbi:MAG: glycoside hydrolase family 16 protein [Oscillospiraceae bacterium]|nr:glycoside hydrolase family 16 protein [Oscillospiraceae bacterium]
MALCGCGNNGGSSTPTNNTSANSTSKSSSAETNSAPENSSAATNSTPESKPESSTPTSTPEESSTPESNGVHADLTGTLADVSKTFECSDGWTNGSMFNCTWRKSNVDFSDGSMKLKIDIDGDGTGKIPYSGAEFRSKDFYGYGMYEVVMKPIKNDGVVSSFFTYTGPSDNNPWDEIDIEFLGKDTTIVQFNYFTNGKGGHEKIYELGFDASEDFHTYGFDWQADKITWYVDGKPVHTAEKDIPSTPSKIMMNVWPGTGVDGWLKAFDGTTPLTAEYKSAEFRKAES